MVGRGGVGGGGASGGELVQRQKCADSGSKPVDGAAGGTTGGYGRVQSEGSLQIGQEGAFIRSPNVTDSSWLLQGLLVGGMVWPWALSAGRVQSCQGVTWKREPPSMNSPVSSILVQALLSGEFS